jgi:FlaA1/EpsC-like NDP-sugar epimerase
MSDPTHDPIRLLLRGFQHSRKSVLLLSIPCFLLVYFTSHWLRFEGLLTSAQLQFFFTSALWAVGLKTIFFAWFGIYQGWGRYLTFHDLVCLVKATTASSVAFVIADYLWCPMTNVPRSIFMMDWAGTVVLIGALRSLARIREELGWFARAEAPPTPVLIVGVNDTGESLLRILRTNRHLSYRVVGFIAIDEKDVGSYIGGVPVLGTIDQTCAIAATRRIGEVLVTSGELTGRQLRHLLEQGDRRNLAIKVLPSYKQLIDRCVDVTPRKVCIEDLLRREPVRLDQCGLHRWLDGRVLLVTGSAGSIGSEICRQLGAFQPRRLVLVDRWESGQFFLQRELQVLTPGHTIDVCLADVADEPRMDRIMAEFRPDIIFHAAAYKHVPLMEENPGEAVKNIVVMTQRLADLAVEHGVSSFVMISTDKAVNPTNVMGACKRVAELYVQSLANSSDCRFVTVRFGNVLDSAGSVVPIFRSQIARGGPVTVTHPEMTRYFMTIPEASQLVIQAGAMGQGGEIFLLDMGSPVRIVDLARDMIRLSGLIEGEDIEIEFTGPRPGEKLFEELHVEGEQTVPTAHPKITVVESTTMSRLEVLRAVKRLGNLSNGPAGPILRELQRVVPQFQHEQLAMPSQRSAA